MTSAVKLGSLVVTAALLGSGLPAANAARLCHGKAATIVGSDSDRDPDELVGTPETDVIVGLGGDDVIDGRGGRDRVCAGDGFDHVRGGPGRDLLAGGRGSDTLKGGSGRDRLVAGRGSVEALFGGRGDDRMFGGRGNFDGLIGGPGDDSMDGGAGLDTAEFWDASGPIEADLESDVATGHGADAIAGIEGVVGSNFDDVISGDAGSNLLVGQEGDDAIDGRDSGTLEGLGSDLIAGGAGDDSLNGGDGDDIVSYEDSPSAVDVDLAAGLATGEGSDSLAGMEAVIGSFFDDTLAGDQSDNAFVGGAGDDLIDGRSGVDEAAYFDSREPVHVDLGEGAATGWGSDELRSVENATGSAFDDTLAGDEGPNELVGGSGGDSLAGLGGDDVLVGSAGPDSADGGDGADACEAETEVACESDPAPGLAARSHRRRGYT